MKLYVVYFRTMQDSPEVRIVGVTTSPMKANAIFEDAKRQEQEWMSDEDPDSGNWAEACMQTFDGLKNVEPGTELYVAVMTSWYEAVETDLNLHGTRESAEKWIDLQRSRVLTEDPDLTPFDEDDDMHLHNESVMSDYYFSIEKVTVE